MIRWYAGTQCQRPTDQINGPGVISELMTQNAEPVKCGFVLPIQGQGLL